MRLQPPPPSVQTLRVSHVPLPSRAWRLDRPSVPGGACAPPQQASGHAPLATRGPGLLSGAWLPAAQELSRVADALWVLVRVARLACNQS